MARSAKPAVGRTTCAEILHGARTQKIERNSYDGLPAYGTLVEHAPGRHPRPHRRADSGKRLATTGGPYPVLKLPPATIAA